MKVVLIAQQGAGTNLLRAFLNSHPDITFYDELFCENKDFGLYHKSGKSVENFLNNLYEDSGKKVIGFDLKYNHLRPDVLQYLKENEDVAVLHLVRDIGGVFFKNHYRLKEGSKYTQKYIRDYADDVKRNVNLVREKFQGRDYFEVTYEDMTRGREITELPGRFEDLLLDWLNVGDYVHRKKLTLDTEHTHISLKKDVSY